MTDKLLELKNVCKSYSLGKKRQNMALNEISLTIFRGETLGLVGESGCGKSTLARVIMGVFPPTSGQLYYGGRELKLSGQRQRKAFAERAQMVFQDPYMSLDPHMTAESIIGENLEIHRLMSREERRTRVYELMEMTGISRECAKRFPHELSGGQRQRIGIARALAVSPEFIVCDEPISALDVSIRSQIVNLLADLKSSLGLTYLFISHDLNIVHHISDRIAVMYAGRIVELGDARQLYEKPVHPYTQMLLKAVLVPWPDRQRISGDDGIAGEAAAAWLAEGGCPFADRCWQAADLCREKRPVLAEVSPGYLAACHRIE